MLSRTAAVTVACVFGFGTFYNSAPAQEIGRPVPRVLNSDPNTPTLVYDPNDRFEEQQVIMKNNHPQLRPQNPREIACFLPPLVGIHTPTVKVAALATQAKASPEYEKACRAIADKKFDLAEKQLRKAVQKFSEYSALWVLLGQVQEKHNELATARESCQRASKVDPTFVPAYLCLADVAARSKDWNEVLKQSDKALALDPASNAISYMFNAGANFNLHRLSDAEKSGLKASEFAGEDIDPRQLHYLLAEIYEAKGDLVNEVAQLREFLKVADGREAEIVKQYLTKLNSPPGKAAPAQHTAK
ncbi:MAG: tetratricopeptide repeat protein [Terriglobales bacterium]